MAAIWPSFISGFVSYVSANNAKSENDTAKKIAQLYHASVQTAMPLLGMAAFNAPIANVTFKYSEGKEGDSTAATSHGGFDSDVDTMNSVLTDITGGSPKYPFTKAILDY